MIGIGQGLPHFSPGRFSMVSRGMDKKRAILSFVCVTRLVLSALGNFQSWSLFLILIDSYWTLPTLHFLSTNTVSTKPSVGTPIDCVSWNAIPMLIPNNLIFLTILNLTQFTSFFRSTTENFHRYECKYIKISENSYSLRDLMFPSVWLNFRQVSSWLEAHDLPSLRAFTVENQ